MYGALAEVAKISNGTCTCVLPVDDSSRRIPQPQEVGVTIHSSSRAAAPIGELRGAAQQMFTLPCSIFGLKLEILV